MERRGRKKGKWRIRRMGEETERRGGWMDCFSLELKLLCWSTSGKKSYSYLYPTFCWSIYLSVYSSIYQSIYWFIFLLLFLSFDLSIYWSSIYWNIYILICLCIDISIYWSIYLFIYPPSIYWSILISTVITRKLQKRKIKLKQY